MYKHVQSRQRLSLRYWQYMDILGCGICVLLFEVNSYLKPTAAEYKLLLMQGVKRH